MTCLRFSAALIRAFLIIILAITFRSIAIAQDRGIAIKQVTSGIAPDGRGKLWAVVIGISSYKNIPPEGQLRFAHRDAEDFAAFLRSPNGGGFPSTQIKLLLNADATLSAVRTALGTWLPRSVEPDDIVYIFFAGHGVVESDTDGYLLAHDSDPQNLYATALPIAELDRIITERLRARIVVLMADACHSGKIGWTSRGAEREVLIGRYLDEVGKSGAGVVRLLATRADERSYEDTRWGGGHGAFTYFLLEGLRGKADRDKDGVIRAGELVDYVAEVVPEQTNALQHPRVAGSIDPRLPLAVLLPDAARAASDAAVPIETVALEIHGAPGSEVYINNTYRGRIRPNGILVVEGLKPGAQEVSLDPPGAEALTQSVMLAAARTILDFKTALPPTAMIKSSPLISQIKETLARKQVLEPAGSWALYQRLITEMPNEPQRASIETALSSALEEIGQRAINDYVNASIADLAPDVFRRGAEAFARLKMLRPADAQIEPKHLFCEGRALISESRSKEAIDVLKRAIELDPRAAYAYNALGIAYEKDEKNDKAKDNFERAAQLAPHWSLPHSHLGIQYYIRGKTDRAEEEFKEAIRLDPRLAFARLLLVRLYRERAQYQEAEKEANDLLRLAPRYAAAYAEVGLLYEAMKQYSKAADAFDYCLKLAPNTKDSDAIRERIAKNRKQAEKDGPRLRRP
ncbi:MAG TPA: tetratricopeptide repeat protein [Blastocatellia bacterium]|nr:tetratricopeptide repeat protein [Blastocatellia bacterium]